MANPLRMILVGAGFMGREHLESTRGSEDLVYVGVVDKSQEVGRSLADEYDLPYFADLAEAISVLSPGAADVCVPTVFHLPLIEACAERGVDVLCEKPVAHTQADADAIASVVEKSGIKLMVAQVIRFWPEYRFVRGLAASKKYGEILAVDCKRLSSPPGWNSWMLKPDVSGGAVIDMQIHDIDFVCQLLGKPSAISTKGQCVDDGVNAAFSQLIYPNGIAVNVECSMLMPSSFPFRMYFKIQFEGAVAEMDFWREKGERLKVFPEDGEGYYPELDSCNPYRAEIEYFARQVSSGGGFDEVPLEESIRSLSLCLASEEAFWKQDVVVIE